MEACRQSPLPASATQRFLSPTACSTPKACFRQSAPSCCCRRKKLEAPRFDLRIKRRAHQLPKVHYFAPANTRRVRKKRNIPSSGRVSYEPRAACRLTTGSLERTRSALIDTASTNRGAAHGGLLSTLPTAMNHPPGPPSVIPSTSCPQDLPMVRAFHKLSNQNIDAYPMVSKRPASSFQNL